MLTIDFSSKRVQLAVRFFTYGVMTVSTLVLSTVLVFFALGYRLDRNLNFTQGGLVQFRSFPENATVALDNKTQPFKTPGKATITAGKHAATMSLNGYHTWSKSFSIDPGQLIWLNYARLIPTTIVTNNIREFPSLAASLVSPDRHWLLLQAKRDAPEFMVADLSNEKDPKFTTLSLPEDLATKKDGQYGTFEIVEWDLKSQYVLIKHQLNNMREYLRVDRTKPNEAVNLSRVFGLSIVEAHFSGNNANIVFANTDGVLRRLDVSTISASGVLVKDIKQFIVYGPDTIAFTSNQASGQIIGVQRGDKVTNVRMLPSEKQVVFAYSEYDDHDYLAIGTTDSSLVEVIRDPRSRGVAEASAVFTQFDLAHPVAWLSFSGNGRMLVAQNANICATYDFEEAKSYKFTFDTGTKITAPLKWLDDFYLWSDAGDRLHIMEFDGANPHEITGLQAGYGVALSSNGKRIFSVATSQKGQFNLQVSRLTPQD